LSQQIRQLEGEIGVPLLLRAQRHVELTDAGQVFLAQARHILAYVEQAQEMARRAHCGEQGQLVLGFTGSASHEVLPVILRAYREKVPQVEVVLREMNTNEQVNALLAQELHVGLLRPPVNSLLLELDVIRREPIVAVLLALHPLTARRQVPIQMLAHEPVVMYPRQLGLGFYDLVITLCRQAGFSPFIRQEAREMQTILGLVAAGLGVSLLPASVSYLRSEGVVYRELEQMDSTVELALAWRSETHSAVVQTFLAIAKETAALIKPPVLP
jgi:DNA-binding transcriptional LysR family regulator